MGYDGSVPDKKILVLGGTSFFGKAFAEEMAKDMDNSVTVFSRRCPKAPLSRTIRQVGGDRCSGADLRQLTNRDWDLVVDNICFSRQEANLAAGLFAGRVGRWVFTSSASVYHAFRKPPLFKEEWPGSPESGPPRPHAEFSYGVGKWEAEESYRRSFREDKFPVVILRFPMVVGPGDPKARGESYFCRIADKGPVFLPGGGRTLWRFVYSKDAVRSFSLAARPITALGEAFNIADSQPILVRDWVKKAFKIMDVPENLVEPSTSWLDEKGFDYAGTPFASEEDFDLDVSKARAKLGWKSTPIDDWLKECVAGFKSAGAPPPGNYRSRGKELGLASVFSAETAQRA